MSMNLTNFDGAGPAAQSVKPSPASNLNLYKNFCKPVLDVALVSLVALLALPIIAVFAALVASDGHTPFYSQKRIGRNGRTFRMWKLRTMVPNADQLLKAYLDQNPDAKAEWDATQKLKNDPRITRVGRLLRKSSMDELPQLFNVLCGDMSIVGPRPMMVNQRGLYPGLGYFRVRPGITGLWQVSDRNECDFHERASYDDIYDNEVSLRTDVSIMMKTFSVVLSGTGY